MVTKYNVSESNQLVSGLQANLDNSKNVYTNLKQAMGNLSNALASNQLQGMTYYSANRYFMQVLNPLVTKGSKIVSDGEGDLKTFTREAKKINDYGDLDKTKLEADKQVKEETKRSAETHLSELNSWKALKTIEPYIYDQLVKTAETTQTQMTKDIKKIDEKLKALETFETNTNELFIDSFTALEAFQRAVAELKNVKISSSGFVTIPDNIFKLISEMDGVKLIAGDSDSTLSEEIGAMSEADIKKWLSENTDLPADEIKKYAKMLRKNPANVMKEILGNEKLLDAILYKAPPAIQNLFLRGFSGLEGLDSMPGKVAEKIINSKAFIKYANSHPDFAEKMLEWAIKLQDKGFTVLVPLKNLVDIVGKGTNGEALIKSATTLLKNSKKFNKVLKTVGGVFNVAAVANHFASAYFDIDSPAYNNADKAAYGALCMMALESGPLELGELGVILGEYVYPPGGGVVGGGLGAGAGFINWIGQSIGKIDKEAMMNSLYKLYDNLNDPEKMDEILKDDILYQQWKAINSNDSI
ncbi:hypothetical protein [Pseudolactococcus reticulitermitis]